MTYPSQPRDMLIYIWNYHMIMISVCFYWQSYIRIEFLSLSSWSNNYILRAYYKWVLQISNVPIHQGLVRTLLGPKMYVIHTIDPWTAKLNNLNFHPLEVVSRYRDPQLQVGENYSYSFNLRPNIYKSWCLDTYFVPNNCDSNGYIKRNRNDYCRAYWFEG